MRTQFKMAFTLVELLVVVSIMVIMLGMSVPAISGYVEQRRLKSSGQIVQNACLEARSRAIAQRERQHVVFFVKLKSSQTYCEYTIPTGVSGATEKTKTGAINSVYSFDSNENTPDGSGNKRIDQVGQPQELPNLVVFERPTDNFCLTFFPDGTVQFAGLTDNANEPEVSTNTDIIFQETGSRLKCYVDVQPNTGRARFSVR